MDFRTKIDLPQSNIVISHRSKIMMLGSCFIENMGKLLIENKFDVNLHPFGILYNPSSISQALKILLEERFFAEGDVFSHNGLYHSFWHHGDFSDADKDKCLNRINREIQKSAEDIKHADILFITFGTAYVYSSKETDAIVGNCHKLPASTFNRYRLSVSDIVEEWNVLINLLRDVNPQIQILLTVSPIRHFKDGAHNNQLSKSTLLLAVDEIMRMNEGVYYFPSYEIVLDELRDYRFYDEDMIHPSSTAVKYIWECFSKSYFSADTNSIINEWKKIYQALNHRPINGEGDEYKHFLRQTLLKLKAFNEKYPYICCNKELSQLEAKV